jgi:5'-3' exonuclease
MRSLPGTHRHCIHGLDADLIMLALATHEPNFFILREEVTFQKAGQTEEQKLHAAIEAAGAATDEPPAELVNHSKPFQFIKISVLRECVTALDKTCFHTPQTHVYMHDNTLDKTCFHTLQTHVHMHDNARTHTHTHTHAHTRTNSSILCASTSGRF